jgi:hypothetical protein
LLSAPEVILHGKWSNGQIGRNSQMLSAAEVILDEQAQWSNGPKGQMVNWSNFQNGQNARLHSPNLTHSIYRDKEKERISSSHIPRDPHRRHGLNHMVKYNRTVKYNRMFKYKRMVKYNERSNIAKWTNMDKQV